MTDPVIVGGTVLNFGVLIARSSLGFLSPRRRRHCQDNGLIGNFLAVDPLRLTTGNRSEILRAEYGRVKKKKKNILRIA